MALLSFLFSISILGVIECAASKTILIILLFCSRGFATGLLQSAYVYTSEVYPTNLRAVALGKSKTTLLLWTERYSGHAHYIPWPSFGYFTTLQMFAGIYRDFAGKLKCGDFKFTGIACISAIPVIFEVNQRKVWTFYKPYSCEH